MQFKTNSQHKIELYYWKLNRKVKLNYYLNHMYSKKNQIHSIIFSSYKRKSIISILDNSMLHFLSYSFHMNPTYEIFPCNKYLAKLDCPDNNNFKKHMLNIFAFYDDNRTIEAISYCCPIFIINERCTNLLVYW